MINAYSSPHLEPSSSILLVSWIFEQILDEIDLKGIFLYFVEAASSFYLNYGAHNNNDDLRQGPGLHVARVALDQVEVSSLGALGHGLELSHDLTNKNYFQNTVDGLQY